MTAINKKMEEEQKNNDISFVFLTKRMEGPLKTQWFIGNIHYNINFDRQCQ